MLLPTLASELVAMKPDVIVALYELSTGRTTMGLLLLGGRACAADCG
jgi:hypothetical protein